MLGTTLAVKRRAASLFVLVLLIAACGGGQSGGTGDTSAGNGAEQPPVSAPSGGDFCRRVADFAVATASDDTVDDMERWLDAFEELAADAPPEIREDMQLWADFNRRLAESTETGEDPGFTEEDLAALEAAGERLDAYFSDVCGIETDTSADDGFASEDSDPFDTQVATLQLTGIADATEEYTGLDVDCAYYPPGELADSAVLGVSLVPFGDGWSVDFAVEGLAELAQGTFSGIEIWLYPPDSSDLADEGVALTSTDATVTISSVGSPRETASGTLVRVEGSYSATDLVNDLDGTPAGSAEGTFACEVVLDWAEGEPDAATGDVAFGDEDLGFVTWEVPALLENTSGGVLCFAFEGEFEMSLISDSDPVTFGFRTEAFTEPGTYVGDAWITATGGDEGEDQTKGQIVVESMEPDGSGFVIVEGTLNAAFTDGPFGPGSLEAEWRCAMTEEELAGG
jgi:hypothetical protein